MWFAVLNSCITLTGDAFAIDRKGMVADEKYVILALNNY